MSVRVIISRSCLLFALDQIMAVKKNIEESQGKESYPWGQQLLYLNDEILEDESTLDEILKKMAQVSRDDFLFLVVSKVGCLYALYNNRICFSSVLCFGLF